MIFLKKISKKLFRKILIYNHKKCFEYSIFKTSTDYQINIQFSKLPRADVRVRGRFQLRCVRFAQSPMRPAYRLRALPHPVVNLDYFYIILVQKAVQHSVFVKGGAMVSFSLLDSAPQLATIDCLACISTHGTPLGNLACFSSLAPYLARSRSLTLGSPLLARPICAHPWVSH